MERAAGVLDTRAGGRPRITVTQRRVSARNRRISRRQALAVLISQREGALPATVVPSVVLVVAVVLEPGLELPLSVDPVAAAAAVAMPANASRSPQARMERRNFVTSRFDCKSEAERAGRCPPCVSAGRRRLCRRRSQPRGQAPLGAAYAIGGGRIATDATFVLC
jgi:hypothetical protein